MARRYLSHVDLLVLRDWLDKQTLTESDTYASLAQEAQKVLKFEKGLTASNVRGLLKAMDKEIPRPQPAPEPDAEPPEPLSNASLQVQLQTIADVVSTWMKDTGRAVPQSLTRIAMPQQPLL